MVFVSNTMQHNAIQYNTKILHNFLVPEQGILFGFFSTSEQGGKFNTPVAHKEDEKGPPR